MKYLTAVILLGLIVVAIISGVIISRRKSVISTAAQTLRLKIAQNASPLTSNLESNTLISNQLFSKNDADFFTGSTTDPGTSSREFLDTYFQKEVFDTLEQRGEYKHTPGKKDVFYTQMLEGTPVYGSQVAVHMKDANKVQGLTSLVVKNRFVEEATKSETDADAIAIEDAKKDTGKQGWNILSRENVIFNNQLLGYSLDEKNYPALKITLIPQTAAPDDAGMVVIVSLTDGKVLYHAPTIDELVNRTVYDCPTFDSSKPSTVICGASRKEGGAAIGIGDVDEAYDVFGKVYDTFDTVLGRKSYDNKDGPLLGRVNLPKGIQSGTSKPCDKGNAWWNSSSKSMFYCAGWVALDVSAHEIGHGVVNTHLPSIGRDYQSGAMNEAIADMFGMTVDNDDWMMGEDVPIGAVRVLDNPSAKNEGGK